jgi:septum formation protein
MTQIPRFQAPGDVAFVLASASPRRLDLLKQIGMVPDRVVPADLDETPRKAEKPRDYATRMAEAKAHAIAEREPGAFILAADTVVAVGRRILPKTETEAEARACLALLSGRRHRVLGGVTVIDPEGRAVSRLVESQVTFKRLSEEEIAVYLVSGEWHGKAGGYAIQGLAAAYIAWLAGSHSNVVGLPLAETYKLFAGLGFRHLPGPDDG